MEITYQKEFFYYIMPELPALFMAHYDEVALDKEHMALSPAWKQYINLETAGVLHILTVRAGGELVGYFFNLVYPHLHYSDVLCSFSDMFFMRPQYRKGWRGVKLFIENEKMLKALGVKKLFIMTKIHIDVIKIIERLRYKTIEYVHSGWIGD